MTRQEFDRYHAATAENWEGTHWEVALRRINNLAYELLADVESDDRDLEDKVKSAFDAANNAL